MNGPQPARQPPPSGAQGDRNDHPQRALAIGFELARNAVKARTLDEVQFVLVNDTRALLPFDRALLVSHFSGQSVLVAVNNQPKLEPKSDLIQKVNETAPRLRLISKALVLFPDGEVPADIARESAEALKEYIASAGCSCLLLVPLSVYDRVVGHLILEFYGSNVPGEVEIVAFMNMVPFLSAALAEKWVLAKDKRAHRAFFDMVSGDDLVKRRGKVRTRLVMVSCLLVVVVAGLCLPMTMVIGGRAEVAPEYEYQAYVQMDGIAQKVFVREGDVVAKDQVVAELEAKEIDYKIRETQRLLESYRREIEILRNMGAENPAKLAESQLVAIKSLRARQELEFLNWRRQFLQVLSPVDGTILTKQVESQVGKRFKAGEAFCKIAPAHALAADVFVRESDVAYLAKSQTGEVYFNFQPDRAYPIRVQSIAPKSETLERIGAVFRVRASFDRQPSDLFPGMAGIAHVSTQRESVWFVMTRRLRTRLSELLLYI
jgi:hypothetical protein